MCCRGRQLMVASENGGHCEVVATPTSTPGRLAMLDILRGIAAMPVVLYHYTSRYAELYGGDDWPNSVVPFGHVGVHLFFIISGYVIFLTLDRLKSRELGIGRFFLARFRRLFPVFWVAVPVTYLVTLIGGLPGRTVEPME